MIVWSDIIHVHACGRVRIRAEVAAVTSKTYIVNARIASGVPAPRQGM